MVYFVNFWALAKFINGKSFKMKSEIFGDMYFGQLGDVVKEIFSERRRGLVWSRVLFCSLVVCDGEVFS